MTQSKANDFTLTIDSDYTSDGTITIDTSSWDDSFTNSPSSIYTNDTFTFTDTLNGKYGLEVEGELKVDGVDVMQSIKDLQRVLGVVSRDLEKEEKYKGLKRAAEAYERELAKIETFETLKDSA
jgi:hypothetical protein